MKLLMGIIAVAAVMLTTQAYAGGKVDMAAGQALAQKSGCNFLEAGAYQFAFGFMASHATTFFCQRLTSRHIHLASSVSLGC